MKNLFSLEGKNAWITGASYGIGFNIAKAFAEAGVENIIFNDINEEMAEMILKAKIKMLESRIADKGISLEISDDAFDKLLKEGFSSEYGAREIERTLNSKITPLLMKEILFGAKKDFKAVVRATDEGYKIEVR